MNKRKWISLESNEEVININELEPMEVVPDDSGIDAHLVDGDVLGEDIKALDNLRDTVESMKDDETVAALPVVNVVVESYCKRWCISSAGVAKEAYKGKTDVLSNIQIAKEGLIETGVKWLKELYERFKKALANLKEFVSNLFSRNKKTSEAIKAAKKSGLSNQSERPASEFNYNFEELSNALTIGLKPFSKFTDTLHNIQKIPSFYDLAKSVNPVFNTKDTSFEVLGGLIEYTSGVIECVKNEQRDSLDNMLIGPKDIDILENLSATIADKLSKCVAALSFYEKELEKLNKSYSDVNDTYGVAEHKHYSNVITAGQFIVRGYRNASVELDKLIVKILKEYASNENDAVFSKSLQKYVDKGDVSGVRVSFFMQMNDKGINTSNIKSIIKQLAKLFPDLFEEFKVTGYSQEMDSDSSKWDTHYYHMQEVYAESNFSKERINHMIRVREHVWPETKG